MVEKTPNHPRFLKIDIERDHIYQILFQYLPENQRERISSFLLESHQNLMRIFEEYEDFEDITTYASVVMSHFLSKNNLQLSLTPPERHIWHSICGRFFEPLASYYLKDLFTPENKIVPGSEIGRSWRYPDAFLVRELDSAFVVGGVFEYKFGVASINQEEKLAKQLVELDYIERYFQFDKPKQKLLSFLEGEKEIMVNPPGYVRKFVVTQVNVNLDSIFGVTFIKIPLPQSEISNICAASLLDFHIFDKKIKIS